MPSPSVIAAAIQFLEDLADSVSFTPNYMAGIQVWLEPVPMRTTIDSVVTKIVPPYISITDGGGPISHTLESIPFECTNLTLLVTADTLEELGNIVNTLRFGGATTPVTRAGFDFAALAVTGFPEAIPILQNTPQFFQEPSRRGDAAIAYTCLLEYAVAGPRTFALFS